jgi:hypothetical protein
MSQLENIENEIKEIQKLMIAYATNGRNDNQPRDYQEMYIELDVHLEQIGYKNPNIYKSIESFWDARGATWADRRSLVASIYEDLLLDIGRKKRYQKDTRNWKKANDKLNDELSSVRQQWLKAKNFIYISPPDYENSMKEAISSVESTLMILLAKPNGTLGKIIKSAKLDKDIERVISHAYGLLSEKDFVRHGGTQQQEITHLEAEFFLEFSASAII